VKLALKIAPYLRGKLHVQTNPYYAYSTDKTVANASREFFCLHKSDCMVLMICQPGIIHLFKEFAPDLDSSRICIKIPGTWEGIMACRTLELTGIHTLATTIFSMPQAVLAAEAGCSYVAPYVNQLKVHFEPE
jgi:transaldolase